MRFLVGAPDEPVSEKRWHEAWESLCRTYRPAMEGIVRRTLLAHGGAVRLDEAEDVVQDFMLACLEKNYLIKADRRIGKFRTFLAVCLRRYTFNYCRARHAKRRLPDQPPAPIDDALDALDAPEETGDEADFEEWARCLVRAAMARVRDKSEANAELLEQLFVDPTQRGRELAKRLARPSRRIALQTHRAKTMLAKQIWECFKDTVSSEADAAAECDALRPYLSRYVDIDEAASRWGS